MLILASQSASRKALLSAAGVPHEAVSPGVDEEAAKAALRAEGLNARGLADALAELKSMRVSRRMPQNLVLGCDQTLRSEEHTSELQSLMRISYAVFCLKKKNG